MKRYSMHEARQNLTDLVNQVAYGRERIMIGRHNKDLAVLVPVEDAEYLEHLEDLEDIKAARKALKRKGKAIAWEEAKKKLGLK
ncbi:MAG TPA: type II toxin-antitoxin system Phd/YefM family antitoxin [bacterium]|nr:type II toxin-antitoxin system Phd/YefM family antitoxin [bacterium]